MVDFHTKEVPAQLFVSLFMGERTVAARVIFVGHTHQLISDGGGRGVGGGLSDGK